jgi:hydrogenase maturation protein HypF
MVRQMLSTDTGVTTRLSVRVRGAVQGVGFRPFVYRLAREMGLRGGVRNSASGVHIEVEGAPGLVQQFVVRLRAEKPPASTLLEVECHALDPLGDEGFEILPSDADGAKSALLTPDGATCTECLKELADPADRRFGYPLICCTQCGPRYTVSEHIPFDRANTTMRRFLMCAGCRGEYADPSDRRFHAQTNACPACGPSVEFTSRAGVSATADAVERAAAVLLEGGVVALKGIGGFQLLADARNGEAVARLRRAKRRDEKPFAVMFGSIEEVAEHCHVGPAERRLLCGDAAPIVLLRPRPGRALAPEVSMSAPRVGAMLPYSPLHHLLLRGLKTPVVATSGNRGGEPIEYENESAFARFKDVADAFLWHDRPIARSCDDSVVKVIGGGETVLRRARGYAPLPLMLRRPLPRILAVGGHFKNTIAITAGRQLLVSEHIAELESVEACDAFARKVESFCSLYGFRPEAVACDLHPLYHSTRYAKSLGLPLVPVQHHHAHLAACAVDNEVDEAYLGVAWDGSGLGLDGHVWGGEFFLWDGRSFARFAHLRPFRLPGGDRAARDGRRCAYSLLREVFGRDHPLDLGLSEEERGTFARMLERDFNSPLTTSAGRLFDAVAALAGVAARSRFEGQAAMLLEGTLEGTLEGARGDEHYPAPLTDGEMLELDWRPLVEGVVRDVQRRRPRSEIALKFHNTLSRWVVQVTLRAGLPRVLLSGGVFQNGYLTERVCDEIGREGLRAYRHRRIPPNDGGLSAGQAVLAARHLQT